MSFHGMVVTDVETDGFEPHLGRRPFLVGMEDERGRTVIAECHRDAGRVKGVKGRGGLAELRQAVEDKRRVKVAHNAKFEIRHFRAMGWRPRGKWICTMNLAVLVDEYQRIDLKSLSRRWNGEDYAEVDVIQKWVAAETKRRRAPWLKELRERVKREEGITSVAKSPAYKAAVKAGRGAPPDATYRDFYESSKANARTMVSYLQKDLDNTMRLAWRFLPQVEADFKVPMEVDRQLTPFVADMEDAGLPVDLAFCRASIKKYAPEREKHARRLRELCGRADFNPRSPPQVMAALKRQGIRVAKADKHVLGLIRDKHEFVDQLLEYRACDKILGFFEKFLETAIVGKDGVARIHARFWQNGEDRGIKTGRFSITDPGLQTLPGGYRGTVGNRGKDVRRAIVPGAPGRVMLSLDFAQVEPRILAHYTGDERIKAAVERGEDIYYPFVRIFFGSRTVDRALKAEASDEAKAHLKQKRSDAKTIILAITYGMGLAKTAFDLNVPVPQARGMRAKCFTEMPSIKDFMDAMSRQVVRQGYVECLFGRRYRVPRHRSYVGINAVIQGAAAIVMKRAIVACGRVLRRWNRGLPKARRAIMHLTVHDEILFSMPAEAVPVLSRLLVRAMETCAPEVSIPLKVDASLSINNWGDKAPLELPKMAARRADEAGGGGTKLRPKVVRR